MSTHRAITMDEPDERPWAAYAWLRAETLAALAELNEQCLEMLTIQAEVGPPAPGPKFPREIGPPAPGAQLLRELAPLLRSLDADARHRAAGCPYLLLDAGFSDQQRWTWVSGNYVRDLERTHVQPFFSVPQATSIARLVLTYAWHLARSQNAAARLLLGMSAHCARLVAVCTLRQIIELAEAHPEWLQPRWLARSRMWRELLSTAASGDAAAIDQARMRGLQLMATDMRALAP
jgi:hypothetical protein